MKTIQFQDTTIDRKLRDLVFNQLPNLQSGTKGGLQLFCKTLILLSIYGTLFTLPFIFSFPGWALFVVYTLVAGTTMASIGMGVMHDASHGAYSKNRKVNATMSTTMYLVGGYLPNWKMQHNVIHHSYTNVNGHDDDLDSNGILRFSPKQEWRPHHRFQYLYAPFLYALMTVLWITTKDFTQVVRYHKEGKKGFENLSKHLVLVFLSKVFYYTFWLVLPLLFWKASNTVVALSFVGMQFVAGFVLGIVFQPAHVTAVAEFSESLSFNSRTEHQVATSCNYAMNSRFLTCLTGGLNYQIEHHLFPNISHVHYRHIAPIVQKFCQEKNIPYNNLGSFWDAVVAHFKFLKNLGRKDYVLS